MFKLYITTLLVLLATVSSAQNKPATKSGKPAATTQKSTSKVTSKATGTKKPEVKGKVSFKIIGKLVGFQYHLMVLNKFRSTEYLLLDSVTTDKDGNFVMQKTINEPCIAYLQHTKNSAVPLIIENGAVLNVTITPTQTTMDYAVSGVKAEKSVRLYNFIKNHSQSYVELGNLEQKIRTEEDGDKMGEYQLIYANKHKDMTSNVDAEMMASGLEGYFVLYNFKDEQRASDVKKVMDLMTPLEKSTVYYSDLKTYYETNKALDIGEIAPDFSLPNVNGETMKLSDLRGKVVLIDFWASWCGPCRAEFPNVKRVYNRFSDKGFEILGVSLDLEESAWKSSIISLGLNWKHVSDLKKWSCAPAKMYKISSIPATVLIDRDGRIIAKNLRGEDLERKLEELFQ